MASNRRRYYIWLLKAYFSRMKRTILSSLIMGILIFFAVIGLVNFYFFPLIFKSTQNIGYAGSFTAQTIPDEIIGEISYGLTKVEKDGSIKPAAAESFTIKDNKIYTFKIKKGQYFHNGKELTSSNLNLNFKDVKSEVIDKYTVQFTLKNAYSPFLTSVSKPIITNDLSGLGKFRVNDIDINGGFVRQITLVDKNNEKNKKRIYFYPTQKALKVAFMLGEVDQANKLSSPVLDGKTDISTWNKVKVEKENDYNSLVAVFYNNADSTLSNKKIRQALNYAISENVPFGKRSFGPINPQSQYYNLSPSYRASNVELSKTLLASVDKFPKLIISTPEEYLEPAKKLQEDWKKIGVETEIKTIDNVPSDFQILLYRVKLPQDPDQYILWHSGQRSNIIHYKNLRIDKLLEDGRSITDIEKRKEIYTDFQKYLNDDAPAAFYYYPTTYKISKN